MNARLSTLLLVAAVAAVPAAPAAAEDRGSDNVEHVANIPYDARYGDTPNYGTDVEFATIRNKRYAMAGSEINGLQIVDITKPDRSKLVETYDCAVSQGDTQVFKRASRTYVTYTNDYEDTANAAKSDCYQDAKDAGFAATEVTKDGEIAKLGTLIVDVTNVRRPETVSFVEIPTGSHNMTVHPSGRFLYNSNSDLATNLVPNVEVYDITNLAKPALVDELTFTPLPGLGNQSHDITFNDAGTRAYSAALSHGVIIDTTDPAAPEVISEFDDEAINVWHQSDPFTIRNDKGEVERELLIVEDEAGGAAGGPVCPSGGVHVFDITDEALPVKVGYWNIDDAQAQPDPFATCTAHVFDIHEDAQLMTIAYYMGGVRVVDLSGLADAPIGLGQGEVALGGAMKQIGFYQPDNANTWSVKTPSIERDGDFYMYGNDINRGFDVYRFDAQAEPAEETGKFLTPAAAKTQLDLLGAAKDARLGKRRTDGFSCLLKAAKRARRA